MWFCLYNKFFEVSSGRIPLELPIRSTNEGRKKVPLRLIAIVEKGEQKVKEKMKAKLHECFPLFRLASPESILEDEEEEVVT
jgi:hypothetical protein